MKSEKNINKIPECPIFKLCHVLISNKKKGFDECALCGLKISHNTGKVLIKEHIKK